jgi:hypothetical protein
MLKFWIMAPRGRKVRADVAVGDAMNAVLVNDSASNAREKKSSPLHETDVSVVM